MFRIREVAVKRCGAPAELTVFAVYRSLVVFAHRCLKRGRIDPDSIACEWLFAEDSTRITDAQRDIIANRCATATQSRIVVTHGTDTMTRRIDPATGHVKAWIDLSTLPETQGGGNVDAVANGIAYDRQYDRLFVTGKYWPHLYEIRLLPPKAPQP